MEYQRSRPGEYTMRIFAYDYAGNRAGGKTGLKDTGGVKR